MNGATVHMDAQDITLQLVGPDTRWEGEDGETHAVPAGKAGLVIQSQTSSVVIVGTPQQLRSLVLDGLSLDVPDGVPLVDAE